MIQLVQYAHSPAPLHPPLQVELDPRLRAPAYLQIAGQVQREARTAVFRRRPTSNGARVGPAPGRELQYRGARLPPPGTSGPPFHSAGPRHLSCWHRAARRRSGWPPCALSLGTSSRAARHAIQACADRRRSQRELRRQPVTAPRGTTTSSPCGKLWTNGHREPRMMALDRRSGSDCGPCRAHVSRETTAADSPIRAEEALAAHLRRMFHVKPKPRGSAAHRAQPCEGSCVG